MSLIVPYVDFSSMSGFILEAVLSTITDCLKVAGKYGGRVFGGFVRDVVIPRHFTPKCDVKFKDVDIWFQNQIDADNFLVEMGTYLISYTIPVGMEYSCDRTQYHLYKDGTCMAWIDVVVSSTIPVDDFDVNFLTALYMDKNYTLKSFSDKSTQTLIDSINQKHATMLQSYLNILLNSGTNAKYLNRLKRSFLEKGWVILCLTEIPSNVSLFWIKQNILRNHIPYVLYDGLSPLDEGLVIPYYSSDRFTPPIIADKITIDTEKPKQIENFNDEMKTMRSLIEKSESRTKTESLILFDTGMEMIKLAFSKLTETK